MIGLEANEDWHLSAATNLVIFLSVRGSGVGSSMFRPAQAPPDLQGDSVRNYFYGCAPSAVVAGPRDADSPGWRLF